MSSTRQKKDAQSLNNKGFELLLQGNCEAAVMYFNNAIILGNLDAMKNRAFMHQNGRGGPVDNAKAIELYERVINLLQTNCPQDHRVTYVYSLYNRAIMHQNGKGGPVDYIKAIELHERIITLETSQAIARCQAVAMYNRACMHENGQGGPVNIIEAIRLYSLADKYLPTLGAATGVTADAAADAAADASKCIRNRASIVNTISTSNQICDQLTNNLEKLLNHGFHQHHIPNIIIECEALKGSLLETNTKIFDLLRDEEKALSETNKLALINNKLRHHPQASDIQSDLETITAVLSTNALPQSLQYIAKHLQCVLSYENSKPTYIDSIKQFLDILKTHLDTNKDRWQIKWFGKWESGTPKNIKKMQDALAKYDYNSDIISLLKAYNIILNTVNSITANKNRHPSVRDFYRDLKESLAKVIYANPTSDMSLDKLAAPIPAATYGTLTHPTIACTTETARPATPPPSYTETMQSIQDKPAAAVIVEHPANTSLYPQLNHIAPLQHDHQFIMQTTNATLAAPARTAAAAAAVTIEQPAAATTSKQFNTQAFCALFPPAPQHPLPSIKVEENMHCEKLQF